MKRITKEEQFQRLKNIAESKGGKLLSVAFNKAKDKYDFECKAGHHFQLTADKVTGRGDWCPYCAGRYGDFNEKYRKIIEEENGGEMLSPYVNGKIQIKCRCANGHEFESLPSNILAGKWCAVCNKSHGERMVEDYLKEHGLQYKAQYRFEGCRGKRIKLPFDFAIFDDKDKLVCVIEYNGEQHYKPYRYSKRRQEELKKFEAIQETDSIKRRFCMEENIPLIVISYFQFNWRSHKMREGIKRILDKELSMLISVPSLDNEEGASTN